MKRLFGKKSKKSPEPSPKHISLGIPANTAAGPLGFRAELDIGPDDEGNNRGSRIVFQDNSGEDKEHPTPEASISGPAVVGTDHRSNPTRESTTDTGEEEGENKLAEVSKVPEREHKNTALRAATILSHVPKEVADGFSPLGSLKAILGAIAAVHANDQEAVAIGNRTENLLSRIAALEEHFYSRPDDVEEQRRRDKLIRYVVIPPLESVLRPFQRVRSHRRTTGVFV
ncbi:hypothetical protein BDM02DRAFT_1798063 [Thelephora ganbajun]|uniref:Uncharacterized protein n=1 Tax=Thelephora ganbajun TaxID=370292 RepID=A0ACB6YZR5_THEGA|nr:hypothetical protein BDM02DRAFT_1798063 [Thelephora ganbajun]